MSVSVAEATDPGVLHDMTDALNNEIERYENYLIKMNPGVSAVVALEDGSALTFGKFNDEWALWINPNPADTNGNQRLLRMSRRLRVAAVHSFAELHATLLVAIARHRLEVQGALVEVREFLAGLPGLGK